MESEYITTVIAEQPTAGSEFPPDCEKTEAVQEFSFSTDLSHMQCPTLVSNEINLEPDGFTYVHTVEHVAHNSVYIAEQPHPAEVAYQITTEVDEEVLAEPGGGARRGKKKKHLKKKKKQSAKKGKTRSIKKENSDKLFVVQSIRAGKDSYICTECGQTFKGRANIVAHLQQHEIEQQYSCNQCPKRFGELSVLLKHLRSSHKGGKEYLCSLCGMKFSNFKTFAAHMRIHSGDQLFVCDVCEKNFRHRSSLSRHKHTHRLEKKDRLALCESSYEPSNLVIHEEVAGSEGKGFVCAECGKGFSHGSSLSRHRQVHAQEKMHRHKSSKNSFGKSAGLKIRLKIHREKSHSGAQHAQSYSLQTNASQQTKQRERLYSCSHCDKCFNHSSSLSRHQQIHVQRPYPCPQCRRSFTTSLHLSNHMEIHKDKKFYSCADCDKRFNHSSSLSRHRQVHIAGGALH
ncbi:zinc finger protein 135-like [Megalops cyprinoides]|uniref:zinc finger protein 135-like n=1 Tax=Megalops cyprinoides TaxID=118141 RepID=UPI0018656106|nr:zinc finger protein 135-like [Megalops cyprinoides]XP_036402017.1 zinc finger protein 135-like [Megalops cyprinoides]